MSKTRKLNLLDYQSGEVVKTFSSIKEACSELGVSANNILIAIKKEMGICKSKS